ncbi:hypothetical protein ABT071_36435 [Streptomyces sp. NPDC002506]|uniref:hypothetical protein n=1 Tax=Streptomyces sp. NPDC002506 TaxID=3154536 RepID=UPI00333434C5
MLVIDSDRANPAKARQAAADHVQHFCLRADRDAVTRVIGELVGNAVRPTARGY